MLLLVFDDAIYLGACNYWFSVKPFIEVRVISWCLMIPFIEVRVISRD